MVFSTTNLFKGIPCPEGEKCALTNCIFSHELRPKKQPPAEPESRPTTQPTRPQDPRTDEPAAKRRKLTSDNAPSKAEQIRSELAMARKTSAVTAVQNSNSLDESLTAIGRQPPSLTRPVTPPAKHAKAASRAVNNSPPVNNHQDISKGSTSRTATKDEPARVETLNPRLVTNDPVGHSKRSLYLRHLHAHMTRLNREVAGSSLEHKQLLTLSQQELVKMALDEEEKVASEQPTLYANVIKQRIATYNKMRVDDWTEKVKAGFAKEMPQTPGNDAKPIHTGLSPDEEVDILPYLITDQSRLAPFGYIPTPPTEAEAMEAAAAVEASKNYEICDRCGARFQVFPERNEEGLLTSNGPCKHHPNKKVFPQKTKGDHAMGHLKEPYYPCCNGVIGSPGCTAKEYHVFKSSSPARLAAVLPFITTPENKDPAKDKEGKKVHAVAFDCEMGYTAFGLELIRLTAVAWPSGAELIDALVRPLGTVIDLNSRFSGVWPEHFTTAMPYEAWKSLGHPPSASGEQPIPPILASPAQARALLCSFLTPATPLIGHAIENDLNAVRLCHPTIIDTIVLYPHPRGLPMRFGLKMLSSKHLNRSIQTGGERGHDSLEDAQATGELVRVKVGEKWKFLKAKGWRMVHGIGLVGPPGNLLNGSKGEGFDGKAVVDRVVNGTAGRKRRKRRFGLDGAEDQSTEDEEVGVESPGGDGGGA